jgi:hypothetical protein
MKAAAARLLPVIIDGSKSPQKRYNERRRHTTGKVKDESPLVLELLLVGSLLIFLLIVCYISLSLSANQSSMPNVKNTNDEYPTDFSHTSPLLSLALTPTVYNTTKHPPRYIKHPPSPYPPPLQSAALSLPVAHTTTPHHTHISPPPTHPS